MCSASSLRRELAISERDGNKAASKIGQGQDPSSQAIEVELKRILASAEFKASQRSRDFLRFVVEETLAGHGDTLKGYTLATRVLGRDKDFDSMLDPIVRIEAGKLRRALERYYLVTGDPGHVRIDIPRGTYVPTFLAPARPEALKEAQHEKAASPDAAWPTVLVRPLQNLTGDPNMNHLAVGLAVELAVELSRCQDMRVLRYRPEGPDHHLSSTVARFTLEGSVRMSATGIKVAVQLLDNHTGAQLWGDTYAATLETRQLLAFQEEVARVVAARVSGERGIIARTLYPESKNKPPTDLRAYEAMLRYHEFDVLMTPEAFIRALEALRRASTIDPECGQIWSMLARLYLTSYALDSFNASQTPLEKGVAFAEKGVHLDPDCQRTRTVLAFARLISSEITAGREEIERALALNPESLFFMDTIGYVATLLGNWQRGPSLINKAIQRNPYYHPAVHYALWVDWVRQENYEQAYQESLKLRRPSVFWHPLIRAASLGLLNRGKEGKLEIDKLLQLKPEFKTQGRTLIKHYMKFDDTVDRLIDGLAQAGLEIE